MNVKLFKYSAAVEILVFAELGGSLSPATPIAPNSTVARYSSPLAAFEGSLTSGAGGTSNPVGVREFTAIPNPSGSRSTTELTVRGFKALPGVASCPYAERGRQPQHPDTQGHDRGIRTNLHRGLPQSCPAARD